MVEKEGWEIRWAKPIGASKFIERQRYIREAVSNSNTQVPVKPCSKQNKKRGAKMQAKVQEDEGVYLAQMKVLQNLVKERYNAVCVFNCVPIQNGTKYMGKVSIAEL